MEELEKDFAAGRLHPSDLKPAVARELNRMMEPVRKHFETDKRAKDLLKRVKQMRTTR